jgi:hypothetical protein
MIRSRDSKLIYKSLMAGEVINKMIPDSVGSELIENPSYTALVDSQMEYEVLYQNIGYKLVAVNEAFYLQSSDNEEVKDSAMDIQVIIEAISIGMQKNHIHKGQFTDYSVGLPSGLIDWCMNDEEIVKILKECNIKDGLDKAIQSKLIVRRLAFKNAHGRLSLSAGGEALFDALLA